LALAKPRESRDSRRRIGVDAMTWRESREPRNEA